MRSFSIAIAVAGAVPGSVTTQQVAPPASTDAQAVAPARYPGFAATLAHQPVIAGAKDWTAISDEKAWDFLARATPATRQEGRWALALGLLQRDRPAEAIGVLDVMVSDDPDLALVPSFQLARGAALTGLNRNDSALAALSLPDLARNPEACAWRMRALQESRNPAMALSEVNCALGAINGRPVAARRPFILSAIRAAIDAGKTAQAKIWLRHFGNGDASANLLRGRAALAEGAAPAATLRFQRVQIAGTAEERTEASVGLIAAAIAQHRIAPAEAIRRLDAIRFGWRGGIVEERALRLAFAQASAIHDDLATLRTGATLIRYFNTGADTVPILARLQGVMAAMLAPDSQKPLPLVAGMFWDYRELTPAGAEGNLMVVHLADRLEAAGLYARAAELLQYQLAERTTDVAQGPLSVKVATLRILAGDPDSAIQALRNTEGPTYPQEMLWDRKRIEAVALSELGKPEAAMAALQDVPDGGALRAEILWRQHDWNGFVATTEATLPRTASLDEVGQAVVLRHAIALASLGREDRLQALHARYSKAFETLPSAGAFNVLTRPVAALDPAEVSAAMGAIPSVSPAGAIADLLDAAPEARR